MYFYSVHSLNFHYPHAPTHTGGALPGIVLSFSLPLSGGQTSTSATATHVPQQASTLGGSLPRPDASGTTSTGGGGGGATSTSAIDVASACVPVPVGSGAVTALCLSPDSTYVFAACADGCVVSRSACICELTVGTHSSLVSRSELV